MKKNKKVPNDNTDLKPHLTAFLGYKAGMDHVVRDVIKTPNGFRTLITAWIKHLSVDFKRRLYKNWYRAQKKAFTNYLSRSVEDRDKSLDEELEKIL